MRADVGSGLGVGVGVGVGVCAAEGVDVDVDVDVCLGVEVAVFAVAEGVAQPASVEAAARTRITVGNLRTGTQYLSRAHKLRSLWMATPDAAQRIHRFTRSPTTTVESVGKLAPLN